MRKSQRLSGRSARIIITGKRIRRTMMMTRTTKRRLCQFFPRDIGNVFDNRHPPIAENARKAIHPAPIPIRTPAVPSNVCTTILTLCTADDDSEIIGAGRRCEQDHRLESRHDDQHLSHASVRCLARMGARNLPEPPLLSARRLRLLRTSLERKTLYSNQCVTQFGPCSPCVAP